MQCDRLSVLLTYGSSAHVYSDLSDPSSVTGSLFCLLMAQVHDLSDLCSVIGSLFCLHTAPTNSRVLA